MRYSEIIEAAQAEVAEKRRRARERLAAADRKRADAARKYQDDLRSARSAAQQAKTRMRSLSVPEAIEASDSRNPGIAQSLLERPRAYPLRDHVGSILGWIEPVGRLLQAKNSNGSVVGWYDPRTNQTRDNKGSIVGTGDLLAGLIMCRRP
jgi:hypothetical protein